MFMGGAGLILICRIMVDLMVATEYYESWRFIPVLILATIFSSFSGFLSSIYMVQKDGKSNLLTMMAGAISNIVMNIILIPKWGAQGAAIATFISYLIVFMLRAAGTKKFIDINISPVFMAVNVLLTIALAVVMVNEISYWIIVSILLTAVIIAFNFIPLFTFVKSLLKSLLGKKKKA